MTMHADICRLTAYRVRDQLDTSMGTFTFLGVAMGNILWRGTSERISYTPSSSADILLRVQLGCRPGHVTETAVYRATSAVGRTSAC